MDKPLFKVSREHHLDHLVAILPLITVLFIIQCVILASIAQDNSIYQLCYAIAFALIGMVSMIYYYDAHHHVEVFDQHLVMQFKPFYKNKKIKLSEIAQLWVIDEESEFSTLQITMKSGHKLNLFFIDRPSQLVKIMRQQMLKAQTAQEKAPEVESA
jgi:hypothetical protein